MATPDDNNHAAIPMRSAMEDSKTPYNYTQAEPKQLQATVTMRQRKRQTDRSRTRRTQEVPFIAACSHFNGKIQCFELRLPPQHKPHATFMQPLQCILHPFVMYRHVV